MSHEGAKRVSVMVTRIPVWGVPRQTEGPVRENFPNHRGDESLSILWGPCRIKEASWHTGVTFVIKVDKSGNSILIPSRREETSS